MHRREETQSLGADFEESPLENKIKKTKQKRAESPIPMATRRIRREKRTREADRRRTLLGKAEKKDKQSVEHQK